MKYRVHLYPTVRVVFEIEAETPETAVRRAGTEFFSQAQHCCDHAVYADEIDLVALVDECDRDDSSVLVPTYR